MLRTLIVLTSLFMLAACNTMQGFGQDIGHAGRAISDTAGNVKREMEK